MKSIKPAADPELDIWERGVYPGPAPVSLPTKPGTCSKLTFRRPTSIALMNYRQRPTMEHLTPARKLNSNTTFTLDIFYPS